MAKIFMNDIANAVSALIGDNTTSILYTKGEGEKAVNVTGADVLAWFEAKAEQATKRNAKAAERNKAKKATENSALVESITKVLANATEPMTGKEIAEALDDEVTSHKIAAVLRNVENVKSEKGKKGANAYSLA